MDELYPHIEDLSLGAKGLLLDIYYTQPMAEDLYTLDPFIVEALLSELENHKLIKIKDDGVIKVNIPKNNSRELLKKYQDMSMSMVKKESMAFRLSLMMFKVLIKRYPKNKTLIDAKVHRWTEDMDLILRVDKRNPKEVYNVFQFAMADEFWKNQIRSPGNLRKHYDRLYELLEEQNKAINDKEIRLSTKRRRLA